jgi:hypothetical protein
MIVFSLVDMRAIPEPDFVSERVGVVLYFFQSDHALYFLRVLFSLIIIDDKGELIFFGHTI